MKRAVHRITLLVLCALLVACASNGTGGSAATSDGSASLTFSSNKRSEAATQIADFLKSLGVDARKEEDASIRVNFDGSIIYLTPNVSSSSGLDRILVHVFYGVKPRWRNSPQMQLALNKINTTYNFATFSLSQNGKTLVIETHVTFVDKISGAELIAALRWVNTSIAFIDRRESTLRKYLK